MPGFVPAGQACGAAHRAACTGAQYVWASPHAPYMLAAYGLLLVILIGLWASQLASPSRDE